MLEVNRIYQGECLKKMQRIDDGSVDMILCDLPYGITACKWDIPLDYDLLWEQYARIIKPRSVIALTGSQPFTSRLVMSRPKLFKYEIIWIKSIPTGFLDAKKRPLRKHEAILIFGAGNSKYNPQMVKGKLHQIGGNKSKTSVYGNHRSTPKSMTDKYYPTSILKIPSERPRAVKYKNRKRMQKNHPTQKPVALFEWLIRTYSDPGDLILDNCIGGGTTAIAAINTGRNFIGIEQSPEYCKMARARIRRTKNEK